MLSGPSMESKHGSLCSVNITGTAVAPMMTWDAKVWKLPLSNFSTIIRWRTPTQCTTVLAMLGRFACLSPPCQHLLPPPPPLKPHKGGISGITRESMIRDGTYHRFYDVVEREWTAKFPSLKGESLPLAMPVAPLPHQLPDFPDCSAQGSRHIIAWAGVNTLTPAYVLRQAWYLCIYLFIYFSTIVVFFLYFSAQLWRERHK